MKQTKPKYFVVKQSKIHNKGVFAKIDIPKGTKVIEYIGEKITKKEADKRSKAAFEKSKKNKSKGSVYIFELNKTYDIDGDVPYNTAKWINHSCDPNCYIRVSKDHIWIIALRKIKKGEELFYNYDFDLEDYEDYPCRCGSKKCVGYMVSEDEWPELKRLIAKKNK